MIMSINYDFIAYIRSNFVVILIYQKILSISMGILVILILYTSIEGLMAYTLFLTLELYLAYDNNN